MTHPTEPAHPADPAHPMETAVPAVPAVPDTRRRAMVEKFPRALWVRLFIYIAVGHLFAAFIYLLFELGGQNQ